MPINPLSRAVPRDLLCSLSVHPAVRTLCACLVSGFCPVIKVACTFIVYFVCVLLLCVYRCVNFPVRAYITFHEPIQLVPLSVFPGNLVLQAVFEGGIDSIFECVDITERIGRETSV